MKKCMKCGGAKMQKGGSTMKTTVGSSTPKGQIYGIPQTGTTNYSAPTMKKGGRVGAIKKMELGGDPGDLWKNLLGFGAAAGLIGAFTTQKGIDRRAKKAEARYEKRLLKKGLPIPVQKSAREITEEYMKKGKRGGSINKK